MEVVRREWRIAKKLCLSARKNIYTGHHQVFEKSLRILCLNPMDPIEKPTACGIFSFLVLKKMGKIKTHYVGSYAK